MQSFNYLFAGYTVIFVLLGFYFVSIGSKVSDLEKRVDALTEED
ncbi:MAG: CcmD family protein [Denitrovibrio sp.]|nr:MAG: CcmD family protein [Denitrovibrio sp.]